MEDQLWRRKANYTSVEIDTFNEITKKYTTIIECKKTDNRSVRRKNEAWERIAREFNSSPYLNKMATSKQLKRLWGNMKTRRRMKEAKSMNSQYNILSNGGDPLKTTDVENGETEPEAIVLTPTLLLDVSGADSDTSATENNSNSMSTTNSQESPTSPQLPSTSMHQFAPVMVTSSSLPLPSPLHPKLPRLAPKPFNIGQPMPRAVFRSKPDMALEREHLDSKRKQNELHMLQKQLLMQQIREARAKADLAELLLEQQRYMGKSNPLM